MAVFLFRTKNYSFGAFTLKFGANTREFAANIREFRAFTREFEHPLVNSSVYS
ncbi:hypothetical protein [Peribacillus frigoritolerans]|uniref:hypothetical protein n=1 Tax=Peribacillus frigoritolerans TaxID=450367 RepID=UPI002079F698|nr:hypothetical protein [Peribacillus frigoritolerans]USK66216.1 hypothetical protein LIT26_06175 [Peribacillus frigoritolerans]